MRAPLVFRRVDDNLAVMCPLESLANFNTPFLPVDFGDEIHVLGPFLHGRLWIHFRISPEDGDTLALGLLLLVERLKLDDANGFDIN